MKIHDPSNNNEVETVKLKTIHNVLLQEIKEEPVRVYSPARSDLYSVLKLLSHVMEIHRFNK